MGRKETKIMCPLCGDKTIKGSRTAGRTMYKCSGCTLTWATPKKHIVETTKKGDK